MFFVNLFSGFFALLIGNAAAGLAGGLAGSLAFAAAAVLCAGAEITGLDGLDMFHGTTSVFININIIYYITLSAKINRNLQFGVRY